MNTLEKHIKISRLLWKQLNDELSKEERKELDSLFNENPKFKKWYFSFNKEKHIDKRLEEYYAIDIEDKWNKFYPRIRKENRIKIYTRVFLRAAAVVLPLFLVYLFSTKFTNDTGQQMAEVEIVPGTPKAVLTLSDGSKINLQESTADTVYDVGNEIKSTGEFLTYSQTENTKISSDVELNMIEVPRGGEFHVELNDGTKVWLNSETTIKYQVPFGSRNREIELSGEAYFEVAHDKEHPFIIKHANGSVTALGTSFNVRVYKDETYVATTLAEGKVVVKNNEHENIILIPGRQAYFNKTDQSVTIKQVDVVRFLMWKNGAFMFIDDRLENIISDLSRWYDFDVDYESDDIKDIHFTFYLNKDIGFTKILELLSKTERVQFDISEKHVLVRKYSK